jgi:hypothetical protein
MTTPRRCARGAENPQHKFSIFPTIGCADPPARSGFLRLRGVSNNDCFQTDQAIGTFGRGCFPPYGRLSGSAQARVNDIVAWERRKGC